ncbi:MAG: hydrogenase nickel incorporation protein HypB [Candidatus Marinimicrobia bacterium]|nr:hydrogenase nickel incorporation protein HypB [Candidatus Neomarinimicrobiota bacterium]
MCDTCGCGSDEVTLRKPGEQPGHSHTHDDHHHDHHHPHDHYHTIDVEQDVLSKNNLLAERNRGYFEALGVLALNLVSSPGSGKTTLLEKTIISLKEKINIAVIEGDQQTMRDADRIEKCGAPVVQINTGAGCHLDADMINSAVKILEPARDSLLMIENVGNLVCPALFDLGEAHKVVIISVTEGDDKPEKYPHMFAAADLCIINKTDLLPYVNFDQEKCKQRALQVNHNLQFIELSAKSGEGLEVWLEWIEKELVGLAKTGK